MRQYGYGNITYIPVKTLLYKTVLFYIAVYGLSKTVLTLLGILSYCYIHHVRFVSAVVSSQFEVDYQHEPGGFGWIGGVFTCLDYILIPSQHKQSQGRCTV